MFNFRTPKFIIAITNYMTERTLVNELEHLAVYKIFDGGYTKDGYKIFKVSFYIKAQTYNVISDKVVDIVDYVKLTKGL